jgi:hypothetical protein
VARRKALLVRALASWLRAGGPGGGVRRERRFLGFSPFDPALPAERVFAAALSHLGPHPLVMCHPGHADAELQGIDPVVATRPQELAYLASAGFATLLERHRGLVLAPAPRTTPQLPDRAQSLPMRWLPAPYRRALVRSVDG